MRYKQLSKEDVDQIIDRNLEMMARVYSQRPGAGRNVCLYLKICEQVGVFDR